MRLLLPARRDGRIDNPVVTVILTGPCHPGHSPGYGSADRGRNPAFLRREIPEIARQKSRRSFDVAVAAVFIPRAEQQGLARGVEGLAATFPPINGKAAGGPAPTWAKIFYASTVISSVA
jgi:hypothetical protein